MANNKNVIIYALGGEVELKKSKTRGFLGCHGYTYDIDVKGKKSLAKDVPTTTGYCVDKSHGTVVIPEDVVSLVVSDRCDQLMAVLDGMLELFENFLKNDDIKNIGIISKFHYLEKLLSLDLSNKSEGELKVGKLVLDDEHIFKLEDLQAIHKRLMVKSKFWFNYDKSVEGGLGMRSANEQSALAEIITVWGTEPETTLTYTPQKAFWNPDTDFNKIVCGTRWFFNTIKKDDFYSLVDGYRRYDFGKLDKKKYYGKITPDVTYSSLFTKTPIELLDKLFNFSHARSKNPKGLLLAGDLQYVKSKAVGRLIDSYPGTLKGKDIVMPFTVSGTENPTLIELIDPPGLSYRISEVFDDLNVILKAFLNRDADNRYGKLHSFINITDKIYVEEINGKGVKKLKMSPNFKQSTLSLRVDATHSKAVKPVPLILSVSYDLPTRNALNSVEDVDVEVWVNVEESDEKCLRYRTITVTNDWIYIQTSAGANVRVLNTAELGI